MQAYQFQSKGPIVSSIKLTTVPKPTPPPSHSLVHIRASAINPADTKNIQGAFPQTQTPRIPGRDFSGVVEGGAHDGLEVWGTGGEHGFGKDGTFAEYLVIPDADLVEKPKNLSFAQAAACGVAFLTSSTMIARAGVKKGDHVLILGMLTSLFYLHYLRTTG